MAEISCSAHHPRLIQGGAPQQVALSRQKSVLYRQNLFFFRFFFLNFQARCVCCACTQEVAPLCMPLGCGRLGPVMNRLVHICASPRDPPKGESGAPGRLYHPPLLGVVGAAKLLWQIPAGRPLAPVCPFEDRGQTYTALACTSPLRTLPCCCLGPLSHHRLNRYPPHRRRSAERIPHTIVVLREWLGVASLPSACFSQSPPRV